MDCSQVEVWGGFECTVARIRDQFRDQVAETGHRERLTDLAAVRALGITTLRYPVLWETVASQTAEQCDWRWHDERLAVMRELGLRPIVGLLHHGSGPLYTSLLDPEFPELFARYAEKVAARYPWLDRFTPINEPLTTARFSALYGHWYPQATDTGSFLRALVLQCRATVLAMRAIRRVTPVAQLVQTEDVGKTFGTPALRTQADYENGRRWLSLDLLCGKVDRHHPWHGIMVQHGIGEDELDAFLDTEAAPDLIGVNHYLTSERYLDERAEAYPAHLRGHNGRQVYADVEAVRVDQPANDLGWAARLREVWGRYGRPVAITEIHHGCTREEQLRWLSEAWKAACTVRRKGVDIKAVTIWSLLGAFDWNSLLTERQGFYEPGAFDIRGPAPRLTALGRAASSLAKTGGFDHPVLDGPGWWRRQDRFYGPARARSPAAERQSRPLLIVGRSGTLAQALARVCDKRGLRFTLAPVEEIGRKDGAFVADRIASHRPWAVVNAAYDPFAEASPQGGNDRTAEIAPTVLARACARLGLPLITFSSDLVFDGYLGQPYTEGSEIHPVNEAGRRAANLDRTIADIHPGGLIIRTGPLFSPWDSDNFAARLLSDLSDRKALGLPDAIFSPAYVPDLLHAALDLLIDGEIGCWHLSNRGQISTEDLSFVLARKAGLRKTAQRVPSERSVPNFALASSRGWPMPTLESAVARFVRDYEAERIARGALAAE